MTKRPSFREVLEAMPAKGPPEHGSWEELREEVRQNHELIRYKQLVQGTSLRKQAAELARLKGYTRQNGKPLRGEDLAQLLFKIKREMARPAAQASRAAPPDQPVDIKPREKPKLHPVRAKGEPT